MMKILFENENFVAVFKEANCLVVPSRMGRDDERAVLGKDLERHLGRKVFPVHRLDYEVSGIVLFALTPEAHRVANGWFENHHVQKTYEAVTEKNSEAQVPEKGKSFEWKCNLLRGKKRAYEHVQGKPSITRAKYIGEIRGVFEWELEPITGRAHQLRYELARHGFPILGDVLYGSKVPWMGAGIALRAVCLKFLLPEAESKWGLPKEGFRVESIFSWTTRESK